MIDVISQRSVTTVAGTKLAGGDVSQPELQAEEFRKARRKAVARVGYGEK